VAKHNTTSATDAFDFSITWNLLKFIKSRGATSSSFRGGGNFHEISFDDVIVLIQPW